MAATALNELPISDRLREMTVVGAGLSPSVAMVACMVMALGYVLVLYVPTFVLRLPPPTSLESFLIRRFTCALVFSAISALATAALLGDLFAGFNQDLSRHLNLLLPLISRRNLFSPFIFNFFRQVERYMDIPVLLSFYGIRKDHMWQAVVFPLFLTSLLYAGSLVSKLLLLLYSWRERGDSSCCELDLCKIFAVAARSASDHALACAHNVVAWRNYVVAPFTEELVFRACMIPLLLCSGFQTQIIIFIGPVFFSLAHLNHFMELYYLQRYSFLKAFSIVGLQLGYTVVFGWYASFLFIRTGNLISAVTAHIFCNVMGLPVLLSPRTRGLATIAFILGLACFFWLLFPASSPILYNNSIESCSCWQGYCSWR